MIRFIGCNPDCGFWHSDYTMFTENLNDSPEYRMQNNLSNEKSILLAVPTFTLLRIHSDPDPDLKHW